MKTYNHFTLESEAILNEDINKFLIQFRQHYRSGRKYSFKEWLSLMSDMVEDLD